MKYAQELHDVLEAEAIRREPKPRRRKARALVSVPDHRSLRSNEGREILNRIQNATCVFSGLDPMELLTQQKGIALECIRAQRRSR